MGNSSSADRVRSPEIPSTVGASSSPDMMRRGLSEQREAQTTHDAERTKLKSEIEEELKQKRNELKALEKTYKKIQSNLKKSPQSEHLSGSLKEVGQGKVTKELEIISYEMEIKQHEASALDKEYDNTPSKNYDKWFKKKHKQVREMKALEQRERELKLKLDDNVE